MKPVSQGNWRLCLLSDEQGHAGPLLGSEPITIGPMMIAGSDQFPKLAMDVYTQIITSAGRRPEPDLDFSGLEFG